MDSLKPPLVIYFCPKCSKVGISPQILWSQGCQNTDPVRYLREPKLRAA